MNAVIDGKRFDTETAELIAEASWGHRGDFGAWWEGLHKTKSGAFFLAGRGGPRSRYARCTGQNEWSGGEAITPMSEKEALEWCEKHEIDADTIAEHFAVQEA